MGQFTTYVRPGMILQVVAVETTYAKGHRGLDSPTTQVVVTKYPTSNLTSSTVRQSPQAYMNEFLDQQFSRRYPNKHDLLAGAQPPPNCSFARHLIGKMVIHCSFAHH